MMDAGTGLRITMILTGIFLMGITMSSLAKRKMTDSFVLTWGLISVIFILAGMILHPVELNHYISGMGMLLVGAISFCLIFGAYFMSVRISELMRRNLELAMQITLMKQELEELREMAVKLQESMEEREVSDEKNTGGNEYPGSGRSGDRTDGIFALSGSGRVSGVAVRSDESGRDGP